MEKKVYVCTDHDSHWPVGVASVVIADSEEEARKLLDEQLLEHGLLSYENSKYSLKEITSGAHVLCDGNY